MVGFLASSFRIANVAKFVRRFATDQGIHRHIADRNGNLIYSDGFAYEKKLAPYPFFSARQKISDPLEQTFSIADTLLDGRTRHISYAPLKPEGWSVFIDRDAATILRMESGFFIQSAISSILLFMTLALLLNQFRNRILAQQLEASTLAEKELNQSEFRFRQLIEESPFPVMIHAEDGEVIMISRTWTELCGYSHADIPTIAIWTEKAFDAQKESVIEVIETLYDLVHRKSEGEYVINTKDGTSRVWDFSSVSLGQLSDGRRIAMSMASDITDRKQVEEEKRNAAVRLMEIEEEIKKQISSDLHDEIGRDLTALGINLEIIRDGLNDSANEKVLARIDDTASLIRSISRTARNVMGNLRPPGLDDFGLITAINHYANQYMLRTDIKVALNIPDEVPRLTDTIELVIFRVLQESFTNCAKHAKAEQVTVDLMYDDGTINLIISDDGAGFIPYSGEGASAISGIGLKSMKERCELVGGTFHLDSQPGKGTVVTVRIEE
ncbi:MAG TPA: PAS domain S-box protein [Desulfuromonadales bacterium]|nr:PAS domain S-box protein [Desulfuromonadales bacterium]